MIVTDAVIVAGMSGDGGWSRKQLALLGVQWPPRAGWKQRLIGLEIRDEKIKEFIRLKGAHRNKKHIKTGNAIVTVEAIAADLEDARTTLQAQSDMIESLTILLTTLQAKARAVVEQIEEADREGPGWAEVSLSSLRELDAASIVEVKPIHGVAGTAAGNQTGLR